MKDFIKSLFILFAASSVFLIGFYLGEEKVRSKISDFQNELEGK
jgi:hypothetical protein